MWRVLHAVRKEKLKTQTNVLRACRRILSKSEAKTWPTSRNTVASAVKKLGSFHARVTRQVWIDLSHHKLDGLEQPIKFTFVDPVFAWSMCAHNLSKEQELHFEYKSLIFSVSVRSCERGFSGPKIAVKFWNLNFWRVKNHVIPSGITSE